MSELLGDLGAVQVPMPTVQLFAPRRHQRPSFESPHRRKLLRWGRRAGKTRLEVLCSSVGHGPMVDREYGLERLFRGFLLGGTIQWIGIDYKQIEKIWIEELVPRFGDVPGFNVEEGEFRITAPAYGDGKKTKKRRGSIQLHPSRSVKNLLGSANDGVVCDEFAHWEGDPKNAWRRIIRPTLVDRNGWAIFGSTPYPGSYNDELCELHPFGADDLPQPETPDKLWFQSHHSTRANDKLSPEAVAEIYAEYPPGDPTADTELEAKLITGAAGAAFPEFIANVETKVHVVHPAPLPRFWRPAAALDWGWRTGCVCTYELGPEDEVVQIHEMALAELHAEAAGRRYIETLVTRGMRIPELIAYDSSMDTDAGIKVGTTLASEFLEGMVAALHGSFDLVPRMQPWSKMPGSRIPGRNQVHKYLAWKDSRDVRGHLDPWAAPRFRVTTACAETIKELTKLQNDPNKLGDVDTDMPDHHYDCLRGLLSIKAAGGEQPTRDTPEDRSPGFRSDGTLKARRAPQPYERRAQARMYDDPLEGGATDSGAPGFWDPFGFNVRFDEE